MVKKLTILWQRLLDDTGRTCPRCGETGGVIETAIEKLKKSFVEIGIDVKFIKEPLNFTQFSVDSLQSNRILINNKTLEEWIGASVGKSKCCDVCGDSDCRTLTFGHNTFGFLRRICGLAGKKLTCNNLIKGYYPLVSGVETLGSLVRIPWPG